MIPDFWKEALVYPKLKQPGLDFRFKNFCPISNLQFISKLVERAVADQIYAYLINNNYLPVHQSAYRPGHSTETALLKVKNDILMNMDKQHVTLLVLLDLSAAFDTVDHKVLLNRLRHDFGITGTVFSWFESYLTGRSQCISVDGVLSDNFKLDFGVPQGSCLGPLLFLLYSSELFKITERHLLQVHSYADDTQLYLSFKPGSDINETTAKCVIENCIADIQQWMTANRLKLNTEKTEFLILGTRKQLEKVTFSHLQVGSSVIHVSPSTSAVKNLGVWLDCRLNMLTHINKISSSAFYYLYNIRRIRKFLTRQSTESLVHAFITSKLDYCNSLLYGLPSVHIAKLQRVQNTAARLVTGLPRTCYITPVLSSLHWLPVVYRIQFKILLLTFKCLHDIAPQYLCDLLSVVKQTRYSLRSSDSLTLVPGSIKCKATMGNCTFQSAAPKLWNNLPSRMRKTDSVNVFKKELKTHLF